MKQEKYGLIGKSLSHSYSQSYFNKKFKSDGLNNCHYDNYEVNNIDQLARFVEQTDCKGLNVTIPYKEAVINFLDELDPLAEAIKAVNTIKIDDDGSTKGFNTDCIGFKDSLKVIEDMNSALILGTGGASRAIKYALKELGIHYKSASRTPIGNLELSYADLKQIGLGEFQLIINCTPVGSWPKIDEKPDIPYHELNQQHYVYDLIYNPKLSSFLRLAEENGAMIQNGEQMLIGQAEAAWKIWQDPTI